MSAPADVVHELHEKAVRQSLWLAMFHAQLCGWTDIEHQLMTLIVHVDELRKPTNDPERDRVV